MAIAPFVVRIPRIQGGRVIVDSNDFPTNDFLRGINDALGQIEESFNGIEQALAAAGIAQAAATSATAAAASATAAAAAASTAAATANAMAASNTKEQALVNSYISPSSVLTATTTTIHVAAHTRYYGDGTSVSVNAGSVPASASGDVDYVYYSDPTRAGGAVTYQGDTVEPTQGMDIHVVGAITIPATGTATGGSGPARPGQVLP